MVKKKPIDFTITENGCFNCISHHINEFGYGVMSVENKKMLIHRFVYKEMFGEIPEGMVIRHKCDNPTCINPEHLQVGTQQENCQDRAIRGRGTKGERVPISVLKEQQVREIKKLVGFQSDKSIALMFSVSETAIGDIRRGKTWKHVC